MSAVTVKWQSAGSFFFLSGANAEARRPDGRCSPSGSLSDPSEQEAARTWKRHHHTKVTERAQMPRIAQTGSLRAQKPFRRLDKETAGNVKHNYRNVLHHSQFIERCLDYWFWNYSCASINILYNTLCIYCGIFVSSSVLQRMNMTSVSMANMHIVLTDNSMEGQSGKTLLFLFKCAFSFNGKNAAGVGTMAQLLFPPELP